MNACKTIAGLLMLCCFSWPSLAADNALTNQEKEEGWKLLFDGVSFDGWRTFKHDSVDDKWEIDDGAIYLSEGGAGDLITKQKYSNFDLKLEWKIAHAGNSGVFILADEKGKYVYSHAPEIQILDNDHAHDNKLDTHLAGSLYDMVAAHKSAFKPAGEWNKLRISLDDGLLQVWLNGVSTTTVVIGSSTWDTLVANSKFADWEGFGDNRSGSIGLQDHGNEVWFKNIKIREIK